MLLPLLLFFNAELYAQVARDLEHDLFVTFSSRHKGQDPGYVLGAVSNNSANAYPCVRIEFNLNTRFDLRPAGREGRHLGVLPLEVQNFQPREVRDYKKRLPFPAGIGLKSVSECPGQPAEASPPKRTAPTTCSIRGQVFGKLKWNTRDDRGRPVSWVLTHISMSRPGDSRPMRAILHGRKYAFTNVPARQKYKIFPEGFRSSPGHRSVSCRPNTTHRGVNFTVTGSPVD